MYCVLSEPTHQDHIINPSRINENRQLDQKAIHSHLHSLGNEEIWKTACMISHTDTTHETPALMQQKLLIIFSFILWHI
jgi:hypothetical protein